MGILFPDSSYNELPGKKDELVELGLFISYKILKLLSFKNIDISGLDNIPRDSNFLLVCNHPAYIDGALLLEILLKMNIDMNFIVHKNVVENNIIGPTLLKKGFLPVSPHRTQQHFMDKGYTPENAHMSSKKRVDCGYKYNRSSLNKAGKMLVTNNVGIFISGKGYEDGMESIFGGYKYIIKSLLLEQDTLQVLPITISYHGNKKNSIPLKSDVKVNILPPSILRDLTGTQKIEESMINSLL